jgi:hypothetical protein
MAWTVTWRPLEFVASTAKCSLWEKYALTMRESQVILRQRVHEVLLHSRRELQEKVQLLVPMQAANRHRIDKALYVVHTLYKTASRRCILTLTPCRAGRIDRTACAWSLQLLVHRLLFGLVEGTLARVFRS